MKKIENFYMFGKDDSKKMETESILKFLRVILYRDFSKSTKFRF